MRKSQPTRKTRQRKIFYRVIQNFSKMLDIYRSIYNDDIGTVKETGLYPNSREDFSNRADSLEAELMETAQFEMACNKGNWIWNTLQRAYDDLHEGNIGISRERENWSYIYFIYTVSKYYFSYWRSQRKNRES